MAPSLVPPVRTSTTCWSVPSISSRPQAADLVGAPGTSRLASARLADTARPAASATAGSSVSGDGVSARRLLKSDSASYGWARDP